LTRDFQVSVSMRKYTSWRRHPWFPTMGGLLGLALGANRKRELTVKVRVNREIVLNDYARNQRLREFLLDNGFEERWNSRVHPRWAGTYYVLEDIYEFTKEPSREEVREACRAIREEWKREIAKVLEEP